MLTTLLLPLLAFQAAQVPTAPPKPPATKVLKRVNGVPITAGDIENELWDWNSGQILDFMVLEQVVFQEAKRLKLTVTPKEIKVAYDKQFSQLKDSAPKNAPLDDYLRQRGMAPSRIAEIVKIELLLDKISMTEFHPADFVKVSMLLVKPKTQEPSDVATAFSEASGYYAQLLKGDAWEKVLSQSKQDPQVIQTKGLIGWRPISAFPATGQVELKALKVGQYTHPVQTQFGVQIFRLEATGVTAPASELQDLKEKYAEGQRSGTLSRLRGAAKIQ